MYLGYIRFWTSDIGPTCNASNRRFLRVIPANRRKSGLSAEAYGTLTAVGKAKTPPGSSRLRRCASSPIRFAVLHLGAKRQRPRAGAVRALRAGSLVGTHMQGIRRKRSGIFWRRRRLPARAAGFRGYLRGPIADRIFTFWGIPIAVRIPQPVEMQKRAARHPQLKAT